jgi:transposase-like protein
MDAVLRLLRGEALDALSRELGVTAATLSSWRDEFLAGGQASLKTQRASEPEDQSRDVKALIGELTIDNECLKALLRKHEERDPLAFRRSKP